MNGTTSQTWAGPEQFDAMDTAADHDFGNLIDFDHLDLDFNIAGYAQPVHIDQQQQLADLSDLQDHFASQIPQQSRDGALEGQPSQGTAGHGARQQPANAFFEYGIIPFSQAGAAAFPQAQTQAFRPQQSVPPTPNSVEMHGDPHRYMQHIDAQQTLFDQRYHMRKDDPAFTPLVSPAVTPHDSRFQIPDFTVPGAYFSPLTSPALNAQNHQSGYQPAQNTPSGSSTGHSPIDGNSEINHESTAADADSQRRLRNTNRRNTARTLNPNGRARQSPITKPNRRKATVSAVIPPKEVSDLMQETRLAHSASGSFSFPTSRDGSETDSISPEPMLSEMGPPPKPGSVTHSPAIAAQANGQGSVPATPASLMRIHPSPNFTTPLEAPPVMEDLTLPEATLDRPGLSRSNTSIRDVDQDTPRLSARKTPKLSALSTPGAGLASKASPIHEDVTTPTSPAFSTISSKRLESKAPRNSKKRNSTSSTLVSPALRPKISPSIKPLLPDGSNGIVDNTHALLLASKSNYQNILDGTTVPGVIYPSSLSTNLTSKRTSHKIAEQGRRNRINMALQEMQALLPSPQINAMDAKSPETSAAGQSSNSKAAKVESAIDYIKLLKQQVSERDALIEEKDKEMEKLRQELAAWRGGSIDEAGEADSGAEAQLKAEPTSSPDGSNDT